MEKERERGVGWSGERCRVEWRKKGVGWSGERERERCRVEWRKREREV